MHDGPVRIRDGTATSYNGRYFRKPPLMNSKADKSLETIFLLKNVVDNWKRIEMFRKIVVVVLNSETIYAHGHYRLRSC